MNHPQTREVTLAVEGMHCDGCAGRLRRRLERAPGVREVAVSFAQRQARVVYDPGTTEERRLVDEIEKSGFRVPGQSDDTHAHSATGETFSAIGTEVSNRGWKPTLLSIPAILASLIPSITCPLCLTGYTALLSTLGLGFLMSSTYLLPLTVAMLAVAVTALGFEGAKRGNWGPFALSLFGSAVILISKFIVASAPATYAGVALLLLASIWNLGPRLRRFQSRRAQPNPVA